MIVLKIFLSLSSTNIVNRSRCDKSWNFVANKKHAKVVYMQRSWKYISNNILFYNISHGVIAKSNIPCAVQLSRKYVRSLSIPS